MPSFIGEVRLLAIRNAAYTPQSLLPCNGQAIDAAQWPALMDVSTRMGPPLTSLPDTRSRAPLSLPGSPVNCYFVVADGVMPRR